MRFVTGEAALIVKNALVVADLHIGFEEEFRRAGTKIPDQAKPFADKILRMVDLYDLKRVIILGDLKHTIAGFTAYEEWAIPRFVDYLSNSTEVTIVPGNHDGGLNRYVDLADVHGISYAGCWLIHGHALPPKKAMRQQIIMSHTHPVLQIRDAMGALHTERVWLIDRHIVVVPAFNPFLGGCDVRYQIAGPMAKYISDDAVIYLLDGIELGRLEDLR